MAVKNILPTNLEDSNLGDINDTNAKLIFKSNVKENLNENSKDNPNKNTFENITASDVVMAAKTNITTVNTCNLPVFKTAVIWLTLSWLIVIVLTSPRPVLTVLRHCLLKFYWPQRYK